MKFSYTAVNINGERTTGVRDASDKFTLAKELKAENLTLVTAEQKKTPLSTSFSLPFFNRVKSHEKIVFARNLAAMLDAGLPVSRALSVIERQSKNAKLKKIIVSLNEEIRKGKTMSEAMKSYSDVFPPLFISMVGAGEESGKLAESLGVVASQMEKTYLLQKKIKGAMMYPSIIIIAMLGIATFMLIYIVPTLTSTFKELGTELPATTQFIITLSELFQKHGLIMLLGIVFTICAIIVASRTKNGKRAIDWVLLHIPVISPLIKETNSARTTRTLSSLLSAGVSVIDALSITRDVIQNSFFKEVIDEAKKRIQVGAPISDVFAQAAHLYPVFVGEMIAVGEETGDLGGTLLRVAVFYEEEVEQKTKDMSTIIEPFLMLVVGAAVGFFALSMISPIYSVADKI